jgi:uncharacterized protein YeaO (DUF488 family)
MPSKRSPLRWTVSGVQDGGRDLTLVYAARDRQHDNAVVVANLVRDA